MTRYCAVNTSSEIFYLDHICPLASLLKIPLIVSDEKNAALTQKYYSEVDLHYFPDLDFRLGELADRFDALISCDYWRPELRFQFSYLYRKDMRLILCPHGQSDKGYKAPSLAPYSYQREVLLYGDLMKKMLQELGLFDSIASPITVGNFRYLYYQTFKEKLSKIVEREVFSHLNPGCKTLLYAPTWKDLDGSTSFFEGIEKLFKEAPKDWNVIVKMHPLLASRDLGFLDRLSFFQEKHRNFLFLHELPFVYPILERIDAYLGDYSSVGYDVLAFQKPMFFFKAKDLPEAKLHTCGQILEDANDLFSSIEKGLKVAVRYVPLQQALYSKAFNENATLLKLHEQI